MMPMLASVALVLQVVANAQLGYRFTLPDGFAAFPEGQTQQDVVDCWTEAVAASPNGALVLCVQRLRGTLGRERMKREELPAAMQLVPFQWKGFPLDGMRTDTAQAGTPVVIFAVQVPLRREAVQLILAGPRDQAQRAQAIMTSTLATLEGETNWLSRTESAGRIGNAVGWIVGIGIGVILIRIWRARQRSHSR